MSPHVSEHLWEYALGIASEEERVLTASHLAECEQCTAELQAAVETVAMVALELPPEAPAPRLLDRLMESTTGRYEGVLDKVARLWDVGRGRARELLEGMATAIWEPSGIPGVDLIHIKSGPAAAHGDAGLIRFASNTQFPFHSHQGDEIQLILEGGMIDDAGIHYDVGDAMLKREGTSHSFVCAPEGCVIAILLVGGIVIDGVRYGVQN